MLLEHEKGDFCGADGQTLSSATQASTNILDLVAARHQLGVGRDLFIWLTTRVIEDYANSDETYIFAFEQDGDDAFSNPYCVFALTDTDGSAIVEADPEAAPLKTAGRTIWCSTIPQTVQERYVRWYFTTTGTTPILQVNAGFGPDRPHDLRSHSQIYVSNIGDP